jgi:hypothetical protein
MDSLNGRQKLNRRIFFIANENNLKSKALNQAKILKFRLGNAKPSLVAGPSFLVPGPGFLDPAGIETSGGHSGPPCGDGLMPAEVGPAAVPANGQLNRS